MAAPLGNNNNVKGKRWQQAIDRALERRGRGDRIRALDDLADKYLEEVERSGILGYREFGDRMDGKAVQTLASDPENPLQVIVQKLSEAK